MIKSAIEGADARDNKRARSGRALESTTTAFLGSYLPGGGLGQLDLFKEIKGNAGHYEADVFPAPISHAGFGYTMVDHWQRVWGDRLTVNLDDLLASGGLATILCLDRSTVDRYLGELQREGLIDLFRVAPPHQVVRRWSDPEEAMRLQLESMYGAHSR